MLQGLNKYYTESCHKKGWPYKNSNWWATQPNQGCLPSNIPSPFAKRWLQAINIFESLDEGKPKVVANWNRMKKKKKKKFTEVNFERSYVLSMITPASEILAI